MKYIVALAALAASVVAQSTGECKSDSDGTFVIKPTNITNAPGQNDKVSSRRVFALAVGCTDSSDSDK